MEQNFETRLFEEKDLTEVDYINRICLPENYNSFFFLNIHRNFPLTFLVATINEKIVGYIMCRIEVGLSNMNRFKIVRKGHIISLAVLSKHRRKGIAHNLLEVVLRNISKYSINECYLEVRVSNKSALNLYQDFNFKISRTIHSYYRDGEDAYLMTRSMV